MVVEPENYFDDFAAAGANGITIHAEVSPHLQRQLARIRELGCAAGVALNPSTPLSAVQEVLGDLDLLLVMTVNPGFGGQKFIPARSTRFARARRMLDAARQRAHALEVDGGINRETIERRVARRRGHVRRRQRGVQRDGSARRDRRAARAVHARGVTERAEQFADRVAVVHRRRAVILSRSAARAALPAATSSSPSRSARKAPDSRRHTSTPRQREKTLADYKGKVVLLNVWATWCVPCRVEMPSIEELHKRVRGEGTQGRRGERGRPGRRGDDSRVREAVRADVRDPARSRRQRSRARYQITGYPETFIIGRDGMIRQKLSRRRTGIRPRRARSSTAPDRADAVVTAVASR